MIPEKSRGLKLAQAEIIAGYWVDMISPFCHRIEIAGSVRRQKYEPRDIEIVCIPKIDEQVNLFGEKVDEHLPLFDFLDKREKEGGISQIYSGDRQRRFYLINGGTIIDLYIVRDPAQFGVIFALRTGPAEFSHWLVTKRSLGGAFPDGAVMQGGCVYADINFISGGRKIEMPDESDFFSFLGVELLEPKARRPKWVKVSQEVHIEI